MLFRSIMTADYGLPGSDKLTNNVKAALQSGAKVVLMKSHGVLICGSNQEETMHKAILLEDICKRNIKGDFEVPQETRSGKAKKTDKAEKLLSTVKEKFPYAALVQTPAVLVCANKGIPIYAQVDDMAQMIGRKIPVVSDNEAVHALERLNAVLVPGFGAFVRSASDDDTKALELLADKAAVCSIHTATWGVKARIGLIDTVLMRFIYEKKYSKQKDKSSD